MEPEGWIKFIIGGGVGGIVGVLSVAFIKITRAVADERRKNAAVTGDERRKDNDQVFGHQGALISQLTLELGKHMGHAAKLEADMRGLSKRHDDRMDGLQKRCDSLTQKHQECEEKHDKCDQEGKQRDIEILKLQEQLGVLKAKAKETQMKKGDSDE